jgi:hypothetical protein
VLKTLCALSTSAQSTIWEKAREGAFLLIYNNINCMQQAWDPDLGQHDAMNSGTAATFVELMNCNVGKAFNPKPLKEARAAGVQAQLTTKVLQEQIDFLELNAVMALHCVVFLIAIAALCASPFSDEARQAPDAR